MIKGFEDITIDVTEREIEIAHFIANSFKIRPAGKSNAAKNKQIRSAIQNRLGEKINDIRLRKIIQHIRSYNLVPRLCSTSTGYFVAKNDEEWNLWKESMTQRIRQMTYTLRCAEYFGDGKNEKL